MNSPIFTKYWTALIDLGITSEVDSALALALHLAIAEAAGASEANALRNQLLQLDADYASLTKDYATLAQQLAKGMQP